MRAHPVAFVFLFHIMTEKAIETYLQKHNFQSFQPRAVLFDMDGVLYDSMPNHAIAWTRTMTQYGLHFTKSDSYATEGARGVDTIRLWMKKQKGVDISEEEAQRIYDTKTTIFHSLPQTKIFEGTRELMADITRAGLIVGVVTGSGQRPLIKRLINDFGEWLDENHIVTAYDVKRGKPNPDPYLMGLKKCGNLEPWQGIVIENAPLGIRAGVAARCFTVAVNSGPLPDSELLNENPDMLFPSIVEVEKNISRLIG